MTRVLQILVVVPKLRKTKGSGTRNDMIAAFGAAVCGQSWRLRFSENCAQQGEHLPDARQKDEAGQK
jgi:hypothetical protein